MSAASRPAPRLVACPTCRRLSPFSTDNRWRPFCSQRCRGIDLGAWASESYRVAGGEPAASEPPPDDASPYDRH